MNLKSLIVIPILALLLVFASCKKDKSGTNSNAPVQFKSNGSAVGYASCIFYEDFDGKNFEALILATNTTNTNLSNGSYNFQIRVTIDSSGLKIGKTYPIATAAGQIGTSMLYYSPDGINTYSTQYANAQGSVTITGITSKLLSGTFSGKLFSTNDTTGQTVIYTFTGGAFNATSD